jgi:hypothetical protein
MASCPACMYTEPELAGVGLSAADAEKRNVSASASVSFSLDILSALMRPRVHCSDYHPHHASVTLIISDRSPSILTAFHWSIMIDPSWRAKAFQAWSR